MLTRILVCGGRDAIIDSEIVDSCLSDVLSEYEGTDIEFVSGAAKGGDKLGEDFAKQHDYDVVQFKPNWSVYGRAAGPIRNKEMIDYIQEADNPVVVAFWDGQSKGTRNTIKLAQDKNIPVHIIRYNNIQDDIKAGIQMHGDDITFNWNEDEPEDVLPLANQVVKKSTKHGHLFYYSFKANKSYDEWNKFLYSLKHSDDIESLQKLADQTCNRLMAKFNEFDCILYPKSSSILNELLIQGFQNIDPFVTAYPISKVSPKDIKFDWDRYNKAFKGDEETYKKNIKSINYMMDRIHKSENFSMQKSVRPMLRKYITEFLELEDFNNALDDIINSHGVLILDDIITSGRTTLELINMLESIGYEGDIIIYSLIYNK